MMPIPMFYFSCFLEVLLNYVNLKFLISFLHVLWEGYNYNLSLCEDCG